MIDHLPDSRAAAALATRPREFPARSAFPAGPPGLSRTAGRGPLVLLTRVFRLLRLWEERSRGRHHLETLGDHALRDIGIHRADLARECEKPFWRA